MALILLLWISIAIDAAKKISLTKVGALIL